MEKHKHPFWIIDMFWKMTSLFRESTAHTEDLKKDAHNSNLL